MKALSFLFNLILCLPLATQPYLGPVLGHVDYREANVVIQTLKPAVVSIQYREISDPVFRFRTDTQRTEIGHGYTAQFRLAAEPGRAYEYQIIIDGKKDKGTFYRFQTPELWRWRKPAPDFSIAFGSCHYTNQPEHDRPGKPYGDTSTDIFNRIADKNPDLMLWLGDNIYLREADWGSTSGIYGRYLHARSMPNVKRLLQQCPNYAIWDDHDFGPNDADGSFLNKNITLQAFHDHWANPTEGMPGQPGITTWFEHGDAQFFLLDNRYNRVPASDSARASILGRVQLNWFKDALLAAPENEWKVVCMGGQFLNTAAIHDNYAKYASERKEILEHIRRHEIKNVIFLTGDRHFAELSLLEGNGMPRVLDFTASPLSSGLYHRGAQEPNSLRVPGTHYSDERNFGVIRFTGQGSGRQAILELYDKNGKQVWQRSFTVEANP